MAGLLAGGTVIYGLLAACTVLLAILSALWSAYSCHKKRQRVLKIINENR